MMKIRKVYLIFTVFLKVLFFTSCSFQEVEVTKIDDVSVKKIDKKGIDLNLAIQIENPNNFSFTIEKILADVYVNNIYVGKIKNYKDLKISKESNNTYPLSFKIEFKSLKENYISATKTILKRKANIRVKGYVKAKKFIFTKKIEFDKSDTYNFLRLNNIKKIFHGS